MPGYLRSEGQARRFATEGPEPQLSGRRQGPTPRTSGRTAPLTPGSEGDSPPSRPGLLPFPFSPLRAAEGLQLRTVPAPPLPSSSQAQPLSAPQPRARPGLPLPLPPNSKMETGRERAGAVGTPGQRGRNPQEMAPPPYPHCRGQGDGQLPGRSARALRHADPGWEEAGRRARLGGGGAQQAVRQVAVERAAAHALAPPQRRARACC